jgi:glycosyltransferase involved in cell wall biosynthesis
VTLSHYITGKSVAERRGAALEVLHSYIRRRYRHDPYLLGFDFSDVRYGLYTSQARPHKNLLPLVQAWEYLIRNRFRGPKLVLTCRLEDDPALHDYIHKNRLQFDVLALSGVPSEVLAALNLLATIAVNPTLFEGGFPFTFPEAYSVGTPSIMSRIPVVLEHVREPELQQQMLFDPHDVASMCERIEWGLSNRQELYEAQRGLYDEVANRSWSVAAADYLALLGRVAVRE